MDIGPGSRSGNFTSTSYPDFVDFRRNIASKADLTAYNMQTAGLNSGDRTDRMWTETVSANYFDVLGVRPVHGRGFVPEEALNAIGNELARLYPQTNAGRSRSLIPIWKAPFGATSIFRPVLMVLTLVVGVVLLIACANVANLLLARGLGRRKEIAVRLSVGANRIRLVSQLLTESILLALLGGLAGLVVVQWCTRLLQTFTPPANLPIHMTLETDTSVLLFALSISVVTGVLFGLTPALQASNPSLVTTLKDETVRLGGAPGHSRTRSTLVNGQVALSLVLLIVAALFVEAMNKAKNIDPGFDPQHLLAASFDLRPVNYSTDRGRAFQKELLDRVRAIPGVESASYIRRMPLGFSGGNSLSVTIDGYVPKPDEEVVLDVNWVGPGYFKTMHTPLLSGRDFEASDETAPQRYVIINDAMARRYWSGRDPLGTKIRVGDSECRVIGVAQTGKYQNLSETPLPYMFLPLWQFYRAEAALVVPGEGDPGAYFSPIRAVMRTMDPKGALPMAPTWPTWRGA